MREIFYVGGYEGQTKLCLYSYAYNRTDASDVGTIEELNAYEIQNSSYLCFSPNQQFIYAVSEAGDGKVASFAVEGEGKLRFLNEKSTGGSPCHLSVSKDGKSLYAANYGGGSNAFFELLPSGEIGDRKVLVEHKNFGKPSKFVPDRQQAPHAHFILPVDMNGSPVTWTCDLGLDTVFVLDENGKEVNRFATPPGFGPRHLAFHPTLPLAYVLGELSCTVLSVDFNMKSSAPLRTLNNDVFSTSAAIRVAPGGKFLLTSNRSDGEGSISVFSLSSEGNIEKLLDVVPCGYLSPRDFIFNTTGDRVFVANQESSKVSIFNWSKDGKLTRIKLELDVQRPTCVLF